MFENFEKGFSFRNNQGLLIKAKAVKISELETEIERDAALSDCVGCMFRDVAPGGGCNYVKCWFLEGDYIFVPWEPE